MPGGIDHQPSVNECWFILNLYRQYVLSTFLVLKPGTLIRLQKSLKPMYHTNIGLGLETGFISGDVQTIGLLLGGEDAAELWFLDLDGKLGAESLEFHPI